MKSAFFMLCLLGAFICCAFSEEQIEWPLYKGSYPRSYAVFRFYNRNAQMHLFSLQKDGENAAAKGYTAEGARFLSFRNKFKGTTSLNRYVNNDGVFTYPMFQQRMKHQV